jgi:hypothetical protein
MNSAAEVAKFIGAVVGGSSVLLLGLAWLLRQWFTHGLTRDLENHKAALDRETQAAAARQRHELEIAAAEVTKRSAMLAEKRAAVIAELYKRLCEFMQASDTFALLGGLIGGEAAVESSEKFFVTSQAFDQYFQVNRIYFSEKLCSGLSEIHVALNFALTRARHLEQLHNKSERTIEEERKAWEEAHNMARVKGPEMLRQIEAEFRGLLGVKES